MLQLYRITEVTIQCSYTASYGHTQDSPSVTVLLGYIDRCTSLNTIMLVTFHYAVIMNRCAPNNTENISVYTDIFSVIWSTSIHNNSIVESNQHDSIQ